jgi:hypothetical protein
VFWVATDSFRANRLLQSTYNKYPGHGRTIILLRSHCLITVGHRRSSQHPKTQLSSTHFAPLNTLSLHRNKNAKNNRSAIITSSVDCYTMTVFWVVTSCGLAEVSQRFRGPYCLHHQGAWLYDPEDSHGHT